MADQGTTISYFRLPTNDNIMVKIHDLHIQGLLKETKLFTAFMLIFYVLGFGISIWAIATEEEAGAIVAAICGGVISLGGILCSFVGLRAIYYQSRNSSLKFYMMLRLFSVLWMIYLLFVYILIGSTLQKYEIKDFLWMSISYLLIGIIFLLAMMKSRELHILLVESIKARLDSSEGNKVYQ